MFTSRFGQLEPDPTKGLEQDLKAICEELCYMWVHLGQVDTCR